ncbi:MAG: MBL fold metallo-hydrolase [Ruminococcus sp.]|nr:MBL fold metallo-hydrolase [Ruminococcus sp.]
MARMYPLFSSSKGNCIYFGDSEGGIMIDCGVSCKRVCGALAENGLSPDRIGGIFVTHTHSDHIKGLTVFLKKHRIPVYAQRRNIKIMQEKGCLPEGTECIPIDGESREVAGFCVKMFETRHDTPASCGYRITYPDGKSAALCTDLGCVTDTVWQSICGCDLVMIESNYDPDMLRHGSYPPELKARIASDFGHLSNAECGETLASLCDSGTMNFVLGHISEENNTPETVERSAVEALFPRVARRDYMLYIAKPESGGVPAAVIF